jgi:cysteine-rich CPCC protein
MQSSVAGIVCLAADRMCQMNDDLHERRKWFKEYFEIPNAMVRRSRLKDFWFTCPVCGYPTHLERGGFDICHLCNWEDDGQDDPAADEVKGGSNGDFSLREARENFCSVSDNVSAWVCRF